MFFFTFSSFGNPRVGMMNCQRNLFEELVDRERVCVFVSKNKTKKKSRIVFPLSSGSDFVCFVAGAQCVSGIVVVSIFMIVTHFGVE